MRDPARPWRAILHVVWESDVRRAAPGSGVGAFRARIMGAVPGAYPGVPGAAAFSVGHRAGDVHAVGAAAGEFWQRVRTSGATQRTPGFRHSFIVGGSYSRA